MPRGKAGIDKQESFGFRIWKRPLLGLPMAHSHSDVEINYLLNGRVQYIHGPQLFELQAPCLAIFWAGVPHQVIEKSDDNEGVLITFPLDWLVQWRIPGTLQDELLSGWMAVEPQTRESSAFDRAMLHRWLDEFHGAGEEQRHVMALELEARIRRLALQQDRTHHKEKSKRKPRVAMPENRSTRTFLNIVQFLNAGYREPISANAVALHTGLHPKYVIQLFRKVSGMKMWDYLIQLRVAHAKRLLLTTDRKVLDIAFDSGFESSSAFYRDFAKFTGMQPKVFRRIRHQ